MVYTIDEIQRRIKPVAEKYNIPTIYLFGSYARGDAREDSDVDILIDRTGTHLQGLFAMGGLYEEFREAVGKNIDLITIAELDDEEANRRNPVFAPEVYRERKKIYG
ncbi:nucleotidyltransferase [Clostridia bacterium]|nr:nucleotidyltransferase [Clostridia bacterium]